jgi:nucleotide-binding universal stress UspA family protein
MLPLKHVLVATDFSAYGARAVARASRLPLDLNSRVTLVHVLPEVQRNEKKALSEARELLDESAASMAGNANGATIHSVVAIGKPFEEILEVARADPPAELVVLGKHGQRRFGDLLIGTTAERVVRYGTCPVLVVQSSPRRPYQRLLAAVELPPEQASRPVDLAVRLLGAARGERRIVHVRDELIDAALNRAGIPERELVKEQQRLRLELTASLQRWIENHFQPDEARRWCISIKAGDPRAKILSLAKRHKPDLICLGTHARTGVSRMFLGSVAEAVLRGAPCDVLIAPPSLASERKRGPP